MTWFIGKDDITSWERVSKLDANQSASNGVCDVVVRAGSVVDAILSAASGSKLKAAKLGNQKRMI